MALLCLGSLGCAAAALLLLWSARRDRRRAYASLFRLNHTVHDTKMERYARTVWGRIGLAYEMDLDSVDDVPRLAVGEEFTFGRWRAVRNPDADRPSIIDLRVSW